MDSAWICEATVECPPHWTPTPPLSKVAPALGWEILMSDQSTDLSEASTPKFPFGKKEIDYLTRVEAAMQNPVQSSTVKMWLEKAQEEGLDPQRIYDSGVARRLPHWMKAPPYYQVNPIATPAKTPNPTTDAGSQQSEPRSKEFGCLLRFLQILPGPGPIPGSSNIAQSKIPPSSDSSSTPSSTGSS